MASWKTVVPNSGLDTNEYLLVAVKTIDQLGWTLHFVSDHGLIAGVPVSAKSNSTGETVTIWFAGNNINVESRSNGFIISTKRNQHNVEQYLSLFDEMQYRINRDEQASLLQWLNGVKSEGEKDVLDPASPAYSDPEKQPKWYQPKKGFFITALLIGVCVVLFGLMVATGADILFPSTEILINWGADARYLSVIEGQWWRIITSCFVHFGILHLGMNMLALYSIGIILEPMIGKWRMLAAFLVTGVGGSIASLLWNPDVVSVGASGAIFGLFGLLLALLTTNLEE